jgi:hypothetical protein
MEFVFRNFLSNSYGNQIVIFKMFIISNLLSIIVLGIGLFFNIIRKIKCNNVCSFCCSINLVIVLGIDIFINLRR